MSDRTEDEARTEQERRWFGAEGAERRQRQFRRSCWLALGNCAVVILLLVWVLW